MEMEMNVHHCMDPEENPVPYWMKQSRSAPVKEELDLVQQFKNDPDSFFPDLTHAQKPKTK